MSENEYKNESVAQEEGPATVSPAPKKKGRKRAGLKRHCQKWWWLHVIIFLVLVVVIVIVIIFAIVPAIAQDKINDAKLEVQGVNVLQTTTDSYRMEINSTISTDGSVHADIDAFEGDLYLEDLKPHTPFTTLQFPKTNSDKHQNVNISQEVKIKNMDAFKTFNIWFWANDTLKITIKGKTKVQPKGLSKKYDVTFKKTMEMKGLNKFEGTKLPVDDSEISTNQNLTKNFNGTAIIPNQSVYTLDIGNVSFSNYANGADVGTLWIENLLLRPGENTVPVSAHLDQIALLTDVQSDKYCKTGIIPIHLTGDNVTNHGQDIPYFGAALSSGNQTVNVDIMGVINKGLHADLKKC